MKTISPGALILSHEECTNCGKMVGVHWLAGAVFFIIITVTTLVSTIAIYTQFGYLSAVVMFPFPIGALGYVKARFFPLSVKDWPTSHSNAHDT